MLGVAVIRDRLGMVSPWMENGNLRNYLDRNPQVDRYEMCIQVAKGMGYLHSKAIYNVVVSSDGVAKLIDFGHTLIPKDNLLFTETTRVGGGTLRWTAPELLLSDNPPSKNKATDVYSLGMTFLEVITGTTPYAECRNDFQIYRILLSKTLPQRPLGHFSDDLSGNETWDLLTRCWAHDPRLRPTAQVVVASISLCSTLRTSKQDTDVPSQGVPVEVPPPQMTASEIFQRLVEHGCNNIELWTDPSKYSSSPIAEGGFGQIWKGQLYDQTSVAIKVSKRRHYDAMYDESKALKQIARETYNWSKLDHQNVHELLGVAIFRERLGVVSRWAPHGNLREYLDRKENLDLYELCIQIGSGMAYIHSREVVHGDLKAVNILVSFDGVLKITDFDSSLISDCSISLINTKGVGGGSLRWMASELFEKAYQKTKQTDVFALGMTFLEVITGSSPYHPECEYPFQVVKKLMDKVFPERSMKYFFNKDPQGDAMWALLTRCWDYDPSARPSTEEVLASVTECATLKNPWSMASVGRVEGF